MSKLFRVEYYLKGMKISAQKIIMNKLNNGFSDFYRDFVNDNSSEYDYYLNVALDKKYQEALDCEEAYGDMGMGN